MLLHTDVNTMKEVLLLHHANNSNAFKITPSHSY
jgi:hypothetical protein